MTDFTAFASCPKHLELLLKDELTALGAVEAREGLAGVFFKANAKDLMRMVMWSRLANRIHLVLDQAKCQHKKDLYRNTDQINWSALCHDLPKTLSIRFNGTNRSLKNTHYSSQVMKDAICDQLDEFYGKRPKVTKADGHLSVYGHLKHDQLTIYQDITGHSLHQRGYREQNTLAPLKENLAAAILIRAGWPELAAQNHNLVDPMCGSGTLLTEGWLIATDQAPNLDLKSHALFSWHEFDAQHWQRLIKEAEERAEQGLNTFRGQLIGVDHHKNSINLAQNNLAGMQSNQRIQFQYQTLDKFRIPPRNNLIVCNPPYGVRLQKNHLDSWVKLSGWLQNKAQSAKAAILVPDEAKAWMLGFQSAGRYALLNGNIPIQLHLFEIAKQNHLDCPEGQWFALPAKAQMLANRIKKNQQRLKSWLGSKQIEAFRIYDADLPEFSMAIDCYQNHVHVQEYQAPKTVDAKKSERHLALGLLAVQSVLQPKTEKVHLKTRQRQKHTDQYHKLDDQENRLVMHEEGRKYLVDLKQYLDTGLFLDHRWLRRQVESQAKEQRVLNLFCYTGSISVAAAKGGARSVDSVDTSKTYLKWAEENLALNGLRKPQFQQIRSDVMQFLVRNRSQYDLIIADPPTYSNSHSRTTDWDVQRDHVQLITACMQALSTSGTLYFSNNFRKFALNAELMDQFQVTDISKQSMDEDFKDSKIHHCFKICHN